MISASIGAIQPYLDDVSMLNTLDDSGALDYEAVLAEMNIGSIGVMRNEHGYVLCKVVAIEPTVDYGGAGHVSVTIKWEVWTGEDQAA